MIFAQMVDDPSGHPDLFPTEKKQEKERQRLFRIIEEMVKWENTINETVLQQARAASPSNVAWALARSTVNITYASHFSASRILGSPASTPTSPTC
ncbi:MAG: DUF1156 domain-containing protein [Candidatus Accumulibacter necessarius]